MGALGAVAMGVDRRATSRRSSPSRSRSLRDSRAERFWGFIPGILKAVSGAHEVVTTIMLNYVAISVLAWAVSGPLKVPGSPSPITHDVGNAALPIVIGDTGHLGILIAFAMTVVVVVAAVPDDARLRDPDRRREPGRRALRRDAAADA